MKNLILKISILLALLIAPTFAVYSQTSGSKIVSKDQTVAFLIRQNESARELIKSQNQRISDLENELSAERENSASILKSYESAKSEISALRESNAALARAVALHESTISILQTETEKQRAKAKKATRDKWKAVAALAGVIALKLIVP